LRVRIPPTLFSLSARLDRACNTRRKADYVAEEYSNFLSKFIKTAIKTDFKTAVADSSSASLPGRCTRIGAVANHAVPLAVRRSAQKRALPTGARLRYRALSSKQRAEATVGAYSY
jgi:hypothetical protein